MIHIETKTRNKHDLRALTLIEMIVSLAVVMFVATIFIFNYQDNNKRTDLIMAAQVLVSDVHRTQNNALGLMPYGDKVPPGGWGLYFDVDSPSEYIMFPDMQAPGESGYHAYNANIESDVAKGARVINLPRGIKISEIRFKKSKIGVSKTKASLSFLPPDPRINIYSNSAGDTSSSTELYVELEDLKNGGLKTIFINFLGLAEVID